MAEQLVVESQELGDGLILYELSGYLDATTFDLFATRVSGRLHRKVGKRNVLISLKGLRGISSAGAGTLLSLSEQAASAGGRLVLCEPNNDVLKVMNILGLLTTDPDESQRLFLVEDREKALLCFQ